MAASRWVVIDDSDSGIQYSSNGWTVESGSKWDKQGNFGATYLGSMHSTKTGGSFSYTYDGSSGAVIGTINIKNTSGAIDPVWECQVDGATIPQGTPFKYTENNWVLCSWDDTKVSAGKHTMTVNVKSGGQAFLFDQFRYLPSGNANVQNAVMLVDFKDPKIQYGDGWTMLGTIARMAPAGGAVMNIPFYGTGISWYSTIPIEMASGSTVAEYTVDGSAPTVITVPGPYGGVTQYHQLVFSIHGLSQGQHTLKVTSKGTKAQAPLVLESLFIEGGSTQEPSPPSGGGASPGTGTGTGTGGSSSLNVAPSSSSSASVLGQSSSAHTSGAASQTNLPASGSSDSNSGGGSGGNKNIGDGGAGSSASNSNQGGSSSSTSSPPPIGAIVGGVVGGLVLIALLIALLFYYRRRNKKNQTFQHAEITQRLDLAGPDVTSSQGARINDAQTQEISSFTPYILNATNPPAAKYAQYGYTKPSIRQAPRVATDYQNPFENEAYSLGQQSETAHSTQAYASHRRDDSYSNAQSSTAGTSSAPTMASNNSIAPLRPVRPGAAGFISKHEAALSEESQPTSTSTPSDYLYSSPGARVINHEDSGLRIPPSSGRGPPAQVVEFPPSYTAS